MSSEQKQRKARRGPTETSSFGAGRRENHDASEFYSRFPAPRVSDSDTLSEPFFTLCRVRQRSLVVTSPPYFVGKEYEQAIAGNGAVGEVPATYIEYLEMLRDVFAECRRVLEPGGRIAVNVANLGRKPYRSLSSDVIRILQDDLGMLLRGEIIWQKAEGATGSVI